MKVNLLHVPPEGLHIEGEEDRDILELPPTDLIQPVSPVRYSLDIGQNAEGVWATGEASLDVRCECVRCLEPFIYPVHLDDFAMQVERPASETVDLTPQLREDILLALPAHPRCDWSGERTCPRQFPTASETPAMVDPADDVDVNGAAARPPSAWEALDSLDLRRDKPQ